MASADFCVEDMMYMGIVSNSNKAWHVLIWAVHSNKQVLDFVEL